MVMAVQPDLWPCGDHMRAHVSIGQYEKLRRWKDVEWVSTYSRGASGPVLAYDIKFPETLKNRIKNWLESHPEESGVISYISAT